MAIKPWYEADPELYSKVKLEVEDAFPELRFIKPGRIPYISGYFPLFDGDRVYDRYKIEIELPAESPHGLPVVKEISERIPRIVDRHMEPDGKACVFLPDAFWFDYPDGTTLLDFLNGPLQSFFACQSLIDLGVSNPWMSGEWKHGSDGILDFYESLLGTRDPRIICGYLDMLKQDIVQGHWLCPCGSKEKLRKCHRGLIDDLRLRIPKSVAAKSVERLLNYLSKEHAIIYEGGS